MKIQVAAGVLRRADGSILIAQRPPGKIAAGRWEFPGGKIEAGEGPKQALARELREELGVEPVQARSLLRIEHAYSDRTVILHSWLVEAWHGEPQGQEGQALAWTRAEQVWDYDLLPADAPIIKALRLPLHLPVTPAGLGTSELLDKAESLARQGHSLIRLREPALPDEAYRQRFLALRECLRRHSAGVIVDRLALIDELGEADGLQLTTTSLHQSFARPERLKAWLFASCHQPDDLAQAQMLGVDAVVLGNVLPTASHPGRTELGWERFEQWSERLNCPVYGIGGLGPEHLQEAFWRGAQGVAGIRAYW